jgi:hypothetical protein
VKQKVMDSIAGKLFEIRDMPVTLIIKPYRSFVITIIKLCLFFAWLVFVSFNFLITLILCGVYFLFFYFTYVFLCQCVKFGYSKIMLGLFFGILYSLVFFAVKGVHLFLTTFYFVG